MNVANIENIGKQLNESWTKKLELIKRDLDGSFRDSLAVTVIVKKFLSQFLAYYNTFFKYVKENHESFHQ